MDADRALDLAAPAEQMAQGEMRLERVVVDLRHLHEQLERFVRAAVQHEVQPANVVGADARRQIAVAVAVDLVDEAERPEHDEQRGQQKRSVSWHRVSGDGWRVRSSASAYFRSCAQPPFFAGRAPERQAGRQQAEQPAQGQHDGERDGHRDLLEAHDPDVDVDRLRDCCRRRRPPAASTRVRDGDESEPAQRYQGASFRA